MHRVYAVKYAERDARRAEHFIGGDPHDAPMPMDYFVWAVVGEHATWVVDTGFGTADASARRRKLHARYFKVPVQTCARGPASGEADAKPAA